LEGLILRSNNIGETEATMLATALEKNLTLKWLNLKLNNIGDAGAEALTSIQEITAWNRTFKSTKAQIVAAFYALRPLCPQLPVELLIQILEHAIAPRPGLRFIILETIRKFEEWQRLADEPGKRPRTTSDAVPEATPPTKTLRTCT
jgi:hypothetical protein